MTTISKDDPSGGAVHVDSVDWKAKKKPKKAAVESNFEIQKFDGDRQIVFGWANISIRKDGSRVVDSQEDIIDPEDLETAAYEFCMNYRETGEMHQGVAKGQMIESFFVTPEKLEKMGLAPDALPGGWWIGFSIPDAAVFAKVKSGEYAMFSIQGTAIREEV